MLEIVRKEVLKYDQEVVEPREKLLFEKAVEEKTRMVYDELGAAEADETVEDNEIIELDKTTEKRLNLPSIDVEVVKTAIEMANNVKLIECIEQ